MTFEDSICFFLNICPMSHRGFKIVYESKCVILAHDLLLVIVIHKYARCLVEFQVYLPKKEGSIPMCHSGIVYDLRVVMFFHFYTVLVYSFGGTTSSLVWYGTYAD